MSSSAFKELQEENWNDTWESSYDPVVIGRECYIHAPFHPHRPGFRLDLVIVPKMSFGTGHHATTRLMVEKMLEVDFTGRKVLDMGCGTGILAILAEKLGADRVLAMDNYPRACENAAENAELNRCRSVLRHRAVVDKYLPKPPPDMPSAEHGLLVLAERSAVLAALRTLPGRQREAIVLRYYADLSEAEIAAAMGISRGAVKSHTARGMAALRAELEHQDRGVEAP